MRGFLLVMNLRDVKHVAVRRRSRPHPLAETSPDRPKGQQCGTFRVSRGVYSLGYAADNAGLWVGDGSRWVHFLDLSSGSARRAFEVPPGTHTQGVYRLSVSADGRSVMASSYARAVVFDVPTGELVLPPKALPPSLFSVLSPNGELLAVAHPSGGVAVWDRPRGQVRQIGPQNNNATALCFSPDSARMAVSYRLLGQVVIYGPREDGRDVVTLDGALAEVLAFTPNGELLAAADGNQVAFWDASTSQRVRVIRVGQAFVRSLAFHPRGQLLATAGDVPVVSLWDLEGRAQGRYDWKIGKVQALAFATDGMTAAAGGSGGKVAVWDLEETG